METLLRLDAVADRAIYAMVANILIGTVIALVLLRCCGAERQCARWQDLAFTFRPRCAS